MSETAPQCQICSRRELRSEGARARGVCARCRENFGLDHEATESPRPALPCRRCGHTVLIRCQVRERAARGRDAVESYLAPLALTFDRKRVTSRLTGRTKVRDIPDFTAPMGMLEAFVCKRCGYVEWYAQRPDEIPIGPEYGTEIVDVTGERGPFR